MLCTQRAANVCFEWFLLTGPQDKVCFPTGPLYPGSSESTFWILPWPFILRTPLFPSCLYSGTYEISLHCQKTAVPGSFLGAAPGSQLQHQPRLPISLYTWTRPFTSCATPVASQPPAQPVTMAEVELGVCSPLCPPPSVQLSLPGSAQATVSSETAVPCTGGLAEEVNGTKIQPTLCSPSCAPWFQVASVWWKGCLLRICTKMFYDLAAALSGPPLCQYISLSTCCLYLLLPSHPTRVSPSFCPSIHPCTDVKVKHRQAGRFTHSPPSILLKSGPHPFILDPRRAPQGASPARAHS